ncbi:hypothetical protein NB491_00290 [Vibrio alginolyticus]|jgi:hypothetical protein|uniref:hypothetical protein n=1 Tax=Vibrio alginolyticus TaxID=663 RepID=UPI0004E1DB2D|nr:hypothetical protein [Vibrio alginolyticus]MCR9634428.1 hypothetical protein [Vibrio alginolyticus]
MYTNIQQPRGWLGIDGCIAADVGFITCEYFHEQMSEFRDFMSEAEVEDIDKAWSSLCFQYESLETPPYDTFLQERWIALMDEWSLRKRLIMSNQSEEMAEVIVKHHAMQSDLYQPFGMVIRNKKG